MFGNLSLALSNIFVLYPINRALNNNDIITAIVLANVGWWSAISHLVENHKHNMPGIGLSKGASYWLNKADVFSVVIVIIRMLMIIDYTVIFDRIPHVIIVCIINLLSEMDIMYVLLHNIWHITVYLLMGHMIA